METTTHPIAGFNPKASSTHKKPNWFNRTRPVLVWSVILLLVNLPLFREDIRTSMIFLPEAVGSGQWWRILTYPLVHLSWYHLALDAGAFIILWQCLEEKRWFARTLYAIGASAGSLLLSLAINPAIFQRGLSGLSGIAHGLMAISAMEMIRHKDQRRWGYAYLAAVAAKSAYELWTGQVLFEFLHMGLCGQPLAASHAGGVIGGLLAFVLLNAGKHKPKWRNRPARRHQEAPLPPPRTQALLCAMVRALTRLLYRVRYEGLGHIPAKGAAVLVCNHVSYVDWLIITSACKRPVHFVMHAAIYRLPVLRWLFRIGRVIPIDSGRKNPAVLNQAFKEISTILQCGGLICIFPEGRLTRTGHINPFRPGVEKIIERNPVPVIPLALRGLWGSFFSHKNGPAMRRWPLSRCARIELAAGRSIRPRQATAINLRCAVQTLYGEAL